MQHHSSRVNGKRRIRHNARVMPAAAFGMVDYEHMVGVVFAKAKAVRVGFFFFVLGNIFVYLFCAVFETESCYASQTSLELFK